MTLHCVIKSKLNFVKSFIMKKANIFVIFVSIFMGASLFGEVIPAKEVQKIRDIIRLVESDLDSRKHKENLKRGLSKVVRDYGFEGIATVSIEEPVLMQALMVWPSFGYERLAKSLLGQATDEAQLEKMLVAIAFSKLALGQDFMAPDSIKVIKDAVSSDLASIGDERLEQIVAVASVAALEHESESNVEASSQEELDRLYELRALYVETLGESSLAVQRIDELISEVEAGL